MTCLKCSAHDVNLQDNTELSIIIKASGASFPVCRRLIWA